MDIIGNVYKSFLKAGFSPKQAKALTAEVGRENNFNSKYVYGSHQDAANNKTNVGFFSWQGERGKELVNNLKNKGLYKNNRIVESQEALDEMAKYTMYEIQNKGAYKKTKERFLSNPDISQNDAAEVLGRDFIRWDMDGKHIKNVADHKRRRDNFYNKLNTNQYKTTEIKASKETEEQTPYINPIDFNTPEYSGMTFSEEEPEQEQTPQQASQDLLEESFLEEADAMLVQSQTQQEQPVQDYAPSPQYNVELNPIEYQPIAQFQDGGEKNSLWKNIRANRGSGRKPTKEMLEQERKIKSKQDGGEIPISSRGMYEFKNENVIVPTSGMITMKNIPHNILGTSLETGETKLMTPNNKYFFKDTQTVLETPL